MGDIVEFKGKEQAQVVTKDGGEPTYEQMKAGLIQATEQIMDARLVLTIIRQAAGELMVEMKLADARSPLTYVEIIEKMQGYTKLLRKKVQ